jgi:hypothetical protein
LLLEKALILGGTGGDVRRAEKVGNDGEQIGAGSDERRRVGHVMPPMAQMALSSSRLARV